MDAILKKLQAAANAYYNTDSPIMSDAEYDQLLDQLPPAHPFRSQVRAAAQTSKTTPLPYLLPSLDKIKPGMPSLPRFLSSPSPIIISEKLDGISALYDYYRKELWLGGDGINGVNITAFAPHIQGLAHTSKTLSATPLYFRGELILPLKDMPAEAVLPRSWVNGLFHQKSPSPSDLKKIHFIAYEVLSESPMKPSQQFELLKSFGYEIPWYSRETAIKEENLINLFKERRQASSYEIDGLVLTRDINYNHPTQADQLKNPKHSMAFKIPLDEQCANTTVKAILWQASRQGYLIPRVHIEPVKIGGSQIEYITGHNAAYIQENSLGPGAEIRVRKSGDIIPIVDLVIKAATPTFPPEGTYEWNDTKTNILSITEDPDTVKQKLVYFFKTIEVPGVGPGTVKTLYEAGLTTPGKILAESAESLKKLLGPTTGQKLADSYKTQLAAATEKKLLLASSVLPRGWGDKKVPEDIGQLPAELTTGFYEWKKQFPGLLTKKAVAPASASAQPQSGLVICFTGFRDKEFQTQLESQGHQVSDSLTKKTTHLIIPSKEFTSTKTEKCRTQSPHTKIVTKEEFLALS